MHFKTDCLYSKCLCSQMNKESRYHPFSYIFLSINMTGFKLPSQIKIQHELLRFKLYVLSEIKWTSDYHWTTGETKYPNEIYWRIRICTFSFDILNRPSSFRWRFDHYKHYNPYNLLNAEFLTLKSLKSYHLDFRVPKRIVNTTAVQETWILTVSCANQSHSNNNNNNMMRITIILSVQTKVALL